MAIDLIPNATPELLKVLLVQKRLDEIKTELETKRNELQIMEEVQEENKDINIDWEIVSIQCRLDVLRTQYAIFQKIAERLPQVCGICHGNRHLGSGMGGYCCSDCEGTGLAKSKLRERIRGS